MKVTYFAASVLLCLSSATATDLGAVMYVGDSITHGAHEISYRWDMHKLLVDNGMTYTPIGIMKGDFYAKPQSPESYGGVGFINVHNAESGGTAAAVAGSEDDGRNKYGDSNITNWMGQSTKTADGTPYEVGETMPCDAPSGFDPVLQVFKGKDAPDRFMMMIGTNDLDATWNGWDGKPPVSKVKDIAYQLDNMEKIYKSVRANNKNCIITLGGVPVWATSKSWKVNDKGRLAVLAYNEALKDWAAKRRDKNLHIADINAGLVDVSLGAENFKGVNTMFNDGLHTSYQGNLIIAGNFAKAQGLAGATAGQPRKDSRELMDITPAKGKSTTDISYAWPAGQGLSKGATIELSLRLGNGKQGGWDKEKKLMLSLADMTRCGTLSIRESSIQWGDKDLYSLDMSQCKEPIRLAWVNGEPDKGLKAGFYVWLGDQLIGEALPSDGNDDFNGSSLTYTGDAKDLELNYLKVDGMGSFAPATKAMSDAKAAYYAKGVAAAAPTVSEIAWNKDGSVTWLSVQGKATASGDDFYTRPKVAGKKESGDVSLALHAGKGTTTRLYGSAGSYNGNVWVDVKAGELAKGTASWYAAHGSGSAKTGASWTLEGSALLKFSAAATGGSNSSAIGAINGGTVTGSIYMEFDAEQLQLGNGYKVFDAAVAAGYNSKIEGDVHLLIKAGQFDADVLGGLLSNHSISGSSLMTISGGHLKGNIYGGGSGGSIEGSSTVVIEGSKPIIHNGKDWGTITAGGRGGKVAGTQSIILSNVKASDVALGFDKFAGTLSGGDSGTRQLILNKVVLDDFKATIKDFDVMTLGEGTHVTLSKPAGVQVKTLVLDSKLSLTIAKGSSFTVDKFGSVFVSFEGCQIINHGQFSFTKDTVVSPEEISSLISGDGHITLKGEWDISKAKAGTQPLASFGENSITITPQLTLNLGKGLKAGRYPLFTVAKATGLDSAITIKGLAAGQKLTLSLEGGILYASIKEK